MGVGRQGYCGPRSTRRQVRAKLSLDAERAQPPLGGRAGERALAATALTSAAFALAACSSSPGTVSLLPVVTGRLIAARSRRYAE